MHTQNRAAVWPTEYRWIAVILVLAALIRTIGLAVWPAVQADEGLWTNSPKNFLMFGDWFLDGRTHLFLSPVFHGLSLAAFFLFEPSVWSARLVSAVAGTVSTLLLYLVVCRTTSDRRSAAITAVVFGLSQSVVFVSRSALIESTELAFLLGAVLLALSPSALSLVAGGVLFGLALLTKLNVVFAAPIVVVYLVAVFVPQDGWRGLWRGIFSAALLLGVAAVVAGAVYYALYRYQPDRFVAAFKFELDGMHFEAISHPLVRFGRFGIDPGQIADTVILLFRQSPFLMVLCALGAAQEVVRRTAARTLFLPWLLFGSMFFLFQMYQPTRYFYLVTPAFAYYAAVAIEGFGDSRGDVRGRWLTPRAMVLATYLLFQTSYVGAGFAVNRDQKLAAVTRWVETNTGADDRIMAAGYLCTDLPRRAYAFYRYDASEDELAASIRRLDISYVIYDKDEWGDIRRGWLDRHYQVVKSWPFGAVYRTSDEQAVPARPESRRPCEDGLPCATDGRHERRRDPFGPSAESKGREVLIGMEQPEP